MSESGMESSVDSGSKTSLVRLVDRGLPPRVRSLLESVLERTSYFEQELASMFDDASQRLFKRADGASNNEEQSRIFEAIRELKRRRAEVFPRFRTHIESSLASVDQPPPKAQSETKSYARAPAKLELIATSDLEISLATQEIASKAEIRNSQHLYILGHRLGIIAGRPPLDADCMPLAPAALVAAFEYAIAEFDLVVEDRINLIQAFDRVIVNSISTFYTVLDQHLITQRVLPNLQFRARRAGSAGGGESQTQHATDAAPEKKEEESANAGAQTSPHPAAAPNAPTNSPSGLSAPPPFPHARRSSDKPPVDATQHDSTMQHPGDGAAAANNDVALFNSLRGLLAKKRGVLNESAPNITSSYQASREDLQSVLGAMQKDPPGMIPQDGRQVSRGIGHLKQDLLNQLRANSPAGQAPVLAQEDSDTIDLVGMLFDYIGQNLSARTGTRDLMAKLQVPVLRTAIRDKNFFTQREHPARVMLNSVAEAGSLLLGEEDADRGLLDKMLSMVDHVSRDFDGDLSLIENLLGDLNQYMGQITRRAEITERRHVDAAKGREKLELARQSANAVVARLIRRSKPQPMVRAVLEQAWTDVLALTLLRQGEDSQSYRRCLAVADQLLQIGTGSDISKIDAKVRDEVRSGLLQVGLHGDEVDSVVGKLFDPENLEEKASNTEIALTLKSKTRLGGEEQPVASKASEASANPVELTPEENEMLQRIRTLPFGTWFEFVTNQQGEMVRRKLAWFSTVTGRCLFVNARGARADERTMEQLARDLVRGQVRLFEAEKMTFIDRAWKAITSTLQQFTSRAPTTASSVA